jgi:four helix bundle protein
MQNPSQVRRAAQSIRANITEGCSRPSNRDFARFLQISIASASELEDHLEFARDVELLTPNEVSPLIGQVVEVRRMLYALHKRVLDERGD